EIDSWCTKCRLVLNHRVIAMVGTKPVRVECSTCGSHHNYRAGAPGERAERSSAAGGGGASSGATRSTSTRSTVTRAEAARREREQTWEKAIAGRAMSDFVRYNV